MGNNREGARPKRPSLKARLRDLNLTAARLRQLKVDLWLDLDSAARAEISSLIDAVVADLGKRESGPPTTKTYASVVGVLIERHRITLKDALSFADPDATTAGDRESLATTYRKLKRDSERKGEPVIAPARLVNDALRRIRKRNQRK